MAMRATQRRALHRHPIVPIGHFPQQIAMNAPTTIPTRRTPVILFSPTRSLVGLQAIDQSHCVEATTSWRLPRWIVANYRRQHFARKSPVARHHAMHVANSCLSGATFMEYSGGLKRCQ